MGDIIMFFGGMVFFVLFAFLAFIFIVFLGSLAVRRSYPAHEPPVSIVIPAYNEEKGIGACLTSIRQQQYPREKIEVIVVDDGSSDRTRDIARQHQDVAVLEQAHEGKSAALNRGVAHAAHRLIFTVDADTVLDRRCLREIVRPFSDPGVGATTGTSTVSSTKTVMETFQNVEYHYNNLIRKSFSTVFGNGIWFFGALACYRRDVLQKIGCFKRDTMTEDMDIALEIRRAGYRTIHAHAAYGATVVPRTLRELAAQRQRWWTGVLQSLVKNRALLSWKASPSIIFLFVNQFWWSGYAFLSLPLIAYQVVYWLPEGGALSIISYLFRWFTLSGPVFVLYKIPEWGISGYSLFGVLSGIISAIMIAAAIRMFRDSFSLRNLCAMFVYFPYTIVLNTIIVMSVIRFRKQKMMFFKR